MPGPALLKPSRGAPPAPGGVRATRHLPDASVICLAAAVAGSGAYLLILQSHLTFFGDDWMFLLDRQGTSVAAFLDPHNGHIALAPVAIYKAMLALFGMDSALPFQVVSTLVFLLSAVLLFAYLRTRVGDWPAVLGCLLILFLGAAWRDLLWSFQIGYFGAIAAGIAALLALERDDRRGDLLACALLVVATAFSELGIAFAVGALVNAAGGAWRRRLPSLFMRRLYVGLLPILLYGIWYLGWGHTAARSASFHNLFNSPKFIFDSIAENIVSLLGLATPFSSPKLETLGGLNLGRILLVAAIGLSIWRLWRMERPSHWLWVVVAVGGTFWFLTALNADLFRTPVSGRYQYPGAIFVLLIAAELLRGVRLGTRAVTASAAVTAAAVISGVIFLHDGYTFKKRDSDNLRARLAALEIGRGHESPNLIFSFHLLIPRSASSYFSAVDEYGSPAPSEHQLARSAVTGRVAADLQLVSEEAIKLTPVAGGAGKGAPASADCHTPNSPQAGLALAPGRYVLSERKLPGAPQLGVPVQTARFADGPAANVGLLRPGGRATISFPHDNSNRPWRLYSPLAGAVTVCKLQQG